MQTVIETIPHNEQRYDTCGDYWTEGDTLQIRVSETTPEYEFLIALHELIEANLCKFAGITDEEITTFDIEFEKNRAFLNTDEPGDQPNAPYRKQHLIATGIEKIIASEIGVDWKSYEEMINKLH